MFLRSILLISMFYFSCFVYAEDLFSVNLASEQKEISFDKNVTITLSLTYPHDYTTSLVEIEKNLFKSHEDQPFQILNKKEDRREKEKIIHHTISFLLDPWDIGTHFLTAGIVTFTNQDKEIKRLSNVISIIVKQKKYSHPSAHTPELLPLNPKTQIELEEKTKSSIQNFNSIKAKRNFQLFQQHNFPWKWFLLILTIILSIWQRKNLSRSLSKIGKKGKQELSPKEKALQALTSLAQKNLPGKNLFEHYYVKLTDIIRKYIEEAFNIDAPECTTEEFLAIATHDSQFSSETRSLLQNFLQEADMVKFARQKSTAENCNLAHQAAVQFVEDDSQ